MSSFGTVVVEPNRKWSMRDGVGGNINVRCEFTRDDDDVTVRFHINVQYTRDTAVPSAKNKRKPPPRYIVVGLHPVPYEDAALVAARPGSRCEARRRIKNNSYGRGAIEHDKELSEAVWVLAFKDKRPMRATFTAPWDVYCDWRLQPNLPRLPVFEMFVRETVYRSPWQFLLDTVETFRWRQVHIRLDDSPPMSGADENSDNSEEVILNV